MAFSVSKSLCVSGRPHRPEQVPGGLERQPGGDRVPEPALPWRGRWRKRAWGGGGEERTMTVPNGIYDVSPSVCCSEPKPGRLCQRGTKPVNVEPRERLIWHCHLWPSRQRGAGNLGLGGRPWGPGPPCFRAFSLPFSLWPCQQLPPSLPGPAGPELCPGPKFLSPRRPQSHVLLALSWGGGEGGARRARSPQIRNWEGGTGRRAWSSDAGDAGNSFRLLASCYHTDPKNSL